MALHIKMKDGEKMIVNGAVLASRGSSHLLLENRAAVMRGRDIMSPEEAKTPARQLYFACTLAYVDEPNLERHQAAILALLTALISTLDAPEAQAACVRFATLVAEGAYYPALAECRELIGYEEAQAAQRAVEAA